MSTPGSVAPWAVAMFTPTASGGHARYSSALLSALAELRDETGIRVSLVSSEDLDPAFRGDGYEIHAMLPPLRNRETFGSTASWIVDRFRFYLKRDRAFTRWAIEQGVDGVHFQEFTPWTAPFDIRRLRRDGVGVFATVHNVRWNANIHLLPAWVPSFFNRRAWRACDGLFVHSESLKGDLSRFLGEGHPPIFVSPHGVWSAAGEPDDIDPTARLELKQLLVFGVLSPYKGIEILLKALPLLPEFRVVIAGATDDPAYSARLREIAAGFPPDRVRIEERFIAESEIPGLFAESTLVVLPYTRFTSQSGVLHDAVAYGVPVVGSDLGAMGESIRAWGIGEVVTPGDVEGLAAGIQATTEPTAYAAAVAATERVRNESSWRTAASVTLAAYGRVFRGKE